MSRGPGRWQRAVLDACTTSVDESGVPQWVSVDEVGNFPQSQRLDRSTREAIRRAIRTLDDRGTVEAGYLFEHRPTTHWRYLFGRVERRVLCARVPLTLEQLELTLRESALLWGRAAQQTRARKLYEEALDRLDRLVQVHADVGCTTDPHSYEPVPIAPTLMDDRTEGENP